jgi:hypothetical protein
MVARVKVDTISWVLPFWAGSPFIFENSKTGKREIILILMLE